MIRYGLAGLLAVTAAAFAADGQALSPPAAGFLTPADYPPDRLLPPPPADGSPKALAELAEVRNLERTRTPAQFEAALSDERTEDATIFAAAIGPAFDLAKLPATARLLEDVRLTDKAAAKAAKDHFRRNRPWIVDPALKTCARDDPPQTSYPSGHTTLGFSDAVILARLLPAKAPAVMARASEYADNRLVCSMHFRSDVVAGQALGTAVALKLLEVPAFRVEFDAAAKELAAAGL